MKKEDTPKRLWGRKYEQVHKAERAAATMQFNTRIPTAKCNEICAFLEVNNIRKIDLIYAGYEALMEKYKPKA